jgi:hypothetical protein
LLLFFLHRAHYLYKDYFILFDQYNIIFCDVQNDVMNNYDYQ